MEVELQAIVDAHGIDQVLYLLADIAASKADAAKRLEAGVAESQLWDTIDTLINAVARKVYHTLR